MTISQERPVLRHALFAVAALALIGYGWFAVQVYRAQESPESFAAWKGTYSWIVGPKARDLTRSAETRMRAALEALNDPKLPGPERLAEFRSSLETAEQLLVRSLRANPAQAKALTDLAAARFELYPPLTPEDDEHMLRMIDLASAMAPRVPRVQQRLGELLLEMGETIKIERRPAMEGRRMTMVVSPVKATGTSGSSKPASSPKPKAKAPASSSSATTPPVASSPAPSAPASVAPSPAPSAPPAPSSAPPAPDPADSPSA